MIIMEDQLLEDLNEIADFIGKKLNSLMPGLKKELEHTPAWPALQIAGSYIHFRGTAQETLGNDPENYSEVHNQALMHCLEMPLTQDFMQNAMAEMFNNLAHIPRNNDFGLGEEFQ